MDSDARRLWSLIEPIHAVTYFAPEAGAAYNDAGLRGFWRGYFAGRAAPMGETAAGVVTATFYGFHPAFVARSVPDIWTMCSPEGALTARLTGVDRALRAVAEPDALAGLGKAATLLERGIDAAADDHRPLFLANRALVLPGQSTDPHLRFWQAATTLREHRGDGHIVALVNHEIGPCESHLLRTASSGVAADTIQPHRGWSDDAWAAARERLVARGLLDIEGGSTTAGHDLVASIEADTDRLAAGPAAAIGNLDDLAELVAPVLAGLARAATIPYPNAMGLPADESG